MSTVASTNRLDRPEMTLRTIEPAQQTAAKVAGFFYLLTTALAAYAEFFVRAPLIVRDDAARTASNIVANAQLFRVSIVCDLLMVAGVVILNLALYQLLAPVHRRLALIAASWRMFEASTHAAATVSGLIVLRLLSGSTTYLYLLVRSRYVARPIALLGLAGSALTVLFVLARMLFPAWEPAAIAAVRALPAVPVALLAMIFVPILAFEVILSTWLLVKGVRIPEHT